MRSGSRRRGAEGRTGRRQRELETSGSPMVAAGVCRPSDSLVCGSVMLLDSSGVGAHKKGPAVPTLRGLPRKENSTCAAHISPKRQACQSENLGIPAHWQSSHVLRRNSTRAPHRQLLLPFIPCAGLLCVRPSLRLPSLVASVIAQRSLTDCHSSSAAQWVQACL